jgi:hypothetical protein
MFRHWQFRHWQSRHWQSRHWQILWTSFLSLFYYFISSPVPIFFLLPSAYFCSYMFHSFLSCLLCLFIACFTPSFVCYAFDLFFHCFVYFIHPLFSVPLSFCFSFIYLTIKNWAAHKFGALQIDICPAKKPCFTTVFFLSLSISRVWIDIVSSAHSLLWLRKR